MTEEKLEQLYETAIRIGQVVLGNGSPGLAEQFADFVKDFNEWKTHGRFETCPYEKSKTGRRWLQGIGVTIGVTVLTVSVNVILKVLVK